MDAEEDAYLGIHKSSMGAEDVAYYNFSLWESKVVQKSILDCFEIVRVSEKWCLKSQLKGGSACYKEFWYTWVQDCRALVPMSLIHHRNNYLRESWALLSVNNFNTWNKKNYWARQIACGINSSIHSWVIPPKAYREILGHISDL